VGTAVPDTPPRRKLLSNIHVFSIPVPMRRPSYGEFPMTRPHRRVVSESEARGQAKVSEGVRTVREKT
jgi:hypothetical protein